MATTWKLEELEGTMAELTDKINVIDMKLEEATAKLEKFEDRVTVQAEVAVGDVSTMLESQTADVSTLLEAQTGDIVGKVTRRLAYDTVFADRLAAAVVARQNVLDPGYFSARARNLSSSGSSLYTLPPSPQSPTPPMTFRARLKEENFNVE